MKKLKSLGTLAPNPTNLTQHIDLNKRKRTPPFQKIEIVGYILKKDMITQIAMYFALL